MPDEPSRYVYSAALLYLLSRLVDHVFRLRSICDLKRFAFAYLYLKCGATSPLGKRIPALIKKARAASLLAVEAFLAASNLCRRNVQLLKQGGRI